MLPCQRPPRRKREPVQTFPDGREVCSGLEYRRRTYRMECRQSFRCAICERTAGSRMQFDHQDGRGLAGGHRDDRIEVDGQWQNAALCEGCNLRKGSTRYHWLNNSQYVPVVKMTEVA